MEVTYIVPCEDKFQFIEAIRIINRLSGSEQIVFYHSYENAESKKDIRFLLLTSSPNLLITLGKLWGQLKMNYDINDVLITCKDITSATPREARTYTSGRIKRVQFLALLLAFLLVALLILYVFVLSSPIN